MTAKATRNPIFKKVQGHVLANQVLLRRPGKAEDIGYTALFLASDESSYIAGTDIVVDGGWFSSAPYLVSERSPPRAEPDGQAAEARGVPAPLPVTEPTIWR
jgi:hypothetical protein